MSTDRPEPDLSQDEADARERLIDLAAQFYDQFASGEVPTMDLPTRTKTNIEYDPEQKVWVYGDRTSTRSASSIQGAQKLRELYYLSESWDVDEAQFASQDESNDLIEDLEIVSGATREDFHMRPEESGATVMGPLRLREQTRRGEREIHCQEDVGEGGYQIPNNPDTIDFLSSEAAFVLCVETGGMRDRLVENGFDEEMDALVVHLKGQPARATRRLTKRLHDELDLPVVVFTDGDPWSYRIYGSVAYGSIKSAHLSAYLATPEADFVGIRPADIVEYDLPTDPLSDSDVNALESELDDPRFQTDFWEEQIELQLDLEKKSEQQSLASRGLDFVTDTYLPERLDEMGIV
jgi:DNA topoisomerase-6 subunit A